MSKSEHILSTFHTHLVKEQNRENAGIIRLSDPSCQKSHLVNEKKGIWGRDRESPVRVYQVLRCGIIRWEQLITRHRGSIDMALYLNNITHRDSYVRPIAIFHLYYHLSDKSIFIPYQNAYNHFFLYLLPFVPPIASTYPNDTNSFNICLVLDPFSETSSPIFSALYSSFVFIASSICLCLGFISLG